MMKKKQINSEFNCHWRFWNCIAIHGESNFYIGAPLCTATIVHTLHNLKKKNLFVKNSRFKCYNIKLFGHKPKVLLKDHCKNTFEVLKWRFFPTFQMSVMYVKWLAFSKFRIDRRRKMWISMKPFFCVTWNEQNNIVAQIRLLINFEDRFIITFCYLHQLIQ